MALARHILQEGTEKRLKWMRGQKTFRVLADLHCTRTKRAADSPFVEMIVAQLDTIADQNWDQLVIARFQQRI
jgi:hypothetical protein